MTVRERVQDGTSAIPGHMTGTSPTSRAGRHAGHDAAGHDATGAADADFEADFGAGFDVGRVDVQSQACQAVTITLARIGDKWSVLVVSLLRGGSRRFSELRRQIPTISQRMLTLTLRGLERDGLVVRTVTPSTPPRVDYALTPTGLSLAVPLDAVRSWAIANHDYLKAARAAYDADHADRA